MENQYSNQWYESLARDLKSGVKAPEEPSVSPAAAAPVITPIDFTDDFANDGFVDTMDTVEVPAKPETKKKTKSKKKKKSDPVTTVILALSICIFLGSAGFLVYKYIAEPIILQQSMNQIKQQTGGNDTEDEVKSAENGIWKSDSVVEEDRNSDGVLTRYEKLLEQNPDTKGWITVPNTPIDYAVTQSKDNEYYLTHNFFKKYDAAGCPYIDAENVVGPNGQLSRCTVIYAHHRRNGTMFAKLKNYDQVEFYKQNPVIRFDTIYDRSEWVVFADFRATTNTLTGKIFEYRKTKDSDFKNDEAFDNFITAIRKRSYFTTPVDVNANDQILLLSTCTYEKEYWRMVIAARKVRDGETIDVRTAEKNNSVLWP